MNKYQKYVCGVLVVIVLLMTIYPPFHFIGERATTNTGFNFIWSGGYYQGTVNVLQLLAQVFIVLILGGISWFALKDKG